MLGKKIYYASLLLLLLLFRMLLQLLPLQKPSSAEILAITDEIHNYLFLNWNLFQILLAFCGCHFYIFCVYLHLFLFSLVLIMDIARNRDIIKS